ALIEGRAGNAEPPSATVVVVASAARLALYPPLFAAIPECVIAPFADRHAALFAIASIRPHAVLVDLEDDAHEMTTFLQKLAANPSLGHTRLYGVGSPATVMHSAGTARI